MTDYTPDASTPVTIVNRNDVQDIQQRVDRNEIGGVYVQVDDSASNGARFTSEDEEAFARQGFQLSAGDYEGPFVPLQPIVAIGDGGSTTVRVTEVPWVPADGGVSQP